VKNVIQNYFNAIKNFCLDGLADPYLKDEFESEHDIASFKEFVRENESELKTISRIRDLLCIDIEQDDDPTMLYKQMLRFSGMIFIKFFSVNWIFSSRLGYKTSHLKYRGAVLRRIENPDSMTGIKQKKPKKPKKNSRKAKSSTY